ncbi:methylenetetrahydrofolate reductase [NAD(P)H] [Alkalilimnicola sp. S0819]|uniref:methylenetetrahydrofolate reductase [NAD(P)H] n=1 Tax=Alkalilimnicola sp. S0819 TaxID=2613922 RepID=UPI001262812C|nr:methylenetetrahydrofolate reductase [NAD(P)H] [Alkalilimnicola sp. S0819]KAB7628138.1 methylenetetrahydrofolate reductase [NAD(P)H] [Alkalilimnicola sp. S0819]MPQ15023.1 methylenetetrahydrofolate reductase [NAD(P)H] [Alkalilimnicola sp. S0819]
MQSQKLHAPVFSFEFFPPKTDEGAAKLRLTRERLAALGPRFFSVTFGAGGSTRDRTFETVCEIQRESGIDAAPHLSCIGSTRENIRDILRQYQAEGIRHIVALRGDLPSGTMEAGEFRYANELVEFIRAETGDYFRIEVACYPEVHPQADNAEVDLANFKRKVEAGADAAITQYFFNADAYFRFVDACEQQQIDLPIVPGIMPILNYKQLARFSDACGAEIPRWLRKRLEAFADDRESLVDYGVDVISEMCRRLLDAGAPGLHFYAMNQAPVTERIWHRLGLGERPSRSARV